MKAVIGWALAGALAIKLLSGCAGSVPEPKDARMVLATAVGYAQTAAEATKLVCSVDPEGKPYDILMNALDKAFAAGAAIEAALNRGEDVSDQVEALEQSLMGIYETAQVMLKERA